MRPALDFDKPRRRADHGLADGLRVDRIMLAALDVRLELSASINRTSCPSASVRGPMMSGAAGLHQPIRR